MRISDWSSDVAFRSQTAAHGQNRPRVHLHHRLARVDHWRAAFAGHYRTLSTQFVLLALQVSHRPRQHCRHLELMLRPFAPGELSNHRMPEWPILLPHSNMSRWSDLTSCTLHDFYRSRRAIDPLRSEEQPSELQSLMRISYEVFCLKKKTTTSTSTLTQLNRQAKFL